jgi:hypothetical protein
MALVNYQMCFSLLHTLGAKHKKNVHYIAQYFGHDPKIYHRNHACTMKVEASFPSKADVSGRFRSDLDPHLWIPRRALYSYRTPSLSSTNARYHDAPTLIFMSTSSVACTAKMSNSSLNQLTAQQVER